MDLGHIDVTEDEAWSHTGDCSVVKPILARIGDKWAVLVVRLLGAGPMRFNELKHKIGVVSQRMLTLTLRGLERDGLVSRTVFPTVPPRVDYALTPLGRSLIGPIRALSDWAFRHQAEIVAARERFDHTCPHLAPQPKPPVAKTGKMAAGKIA
ncbi:winged helix-turn-helix transcriptional regulator [Phreatobacter stygius]|uniref:Helix-turn-helix transcriptional regulator n=1 Tax=Phreatobacter stygius TaxID=1940610 RepID=A0A4D7BME3_9HYPH|nr:helix-turn-helix domain-containing protein [Phreatobacter stygius]QCI68947.1 helix-turn-helix transcriptional regulator [Phreatobacter stygius]